jgi:hypothetical protein
MLTAGFVPTVQRTRTSPLSSISKISGVETGFLPRSSAGTFHRRARSFMWSGSSQLRYAG